jgi:hypothetical protein
VRAFVTVAAKWVVLLVAALLFMLSMDVFDIEVGFWSQVGAFLIHALPGFAVLGISLLFWKKPLWYGAFQIAIAIALTIVFGEMDGRFNTGLLGITLPLVLAGGWLVFVGLGERKKPT